MRDPARVRAARQAWEARQIANGRCRSCGQLRVDGSALYCLIHQGKARGYQRVSVRAKRAAVSVTADWSEG